MDLNPSAGSVTAKNQRLHTRGASRRGVQIIILHKILRGQGSSDLSIRNAKSSQGIIDLEANNTKIKTVFPRES